MGTVIIFMLVCMCILLGDVVDVIDAFLDLAIALVLIYIVAMVVTAIL